MSRTGDVNYFHRPGLYRCVQCRMVMDHRVHIFPECPSCGSATTWVATVREPALRRARAHH